MKIGISGPSRAGKTAVVTKLKSNSWIKKQSFSAPAPPADQHIKAASDLQTNEAVPLQTFIFNDHLKNIIFTTPNVIAETTILDSLVKLLKLTREGACPVSTFDIYTKNVIDNIDKYDQIFIIPNDSEDDMQDYTDIMNIIGTSTDKIITLDLLNTKKYHDIIVMSIQEKYKQGISTNEENSNKWLTEYGQDYFSTLSRETTGARGV